ncbi:hypothetical protein SH661x_004353 [Planctomicrobium sp. SH661]|uniref:hypothetical protein n=1 Tax=Planctomicrobium sp. SH661 TaxID=3448124 RepID=UPI003F5B56E8
MGDPFKKVQRGDPLRIPAETFNTLLDAARDFKSRQQSTQRNSVPSARSNSQTRVRNQTGGDRNLFEVVQLAGPLIGPADNLPEYLQQTSFNGGPIEEEGEDRVAILQEPCPAGSIRSAVHAGVSIARLTGKTGKSRATTVPGSYALRSGRTGPFVILHDPGPEDQERYAVVRFGELPQNETVLFEIESLCEPAGAGEDEDCDCGPGCFYSAVLYESCGTRTPDRIRVYDFTGCHFEGDPEELIGCRGIATRLQQHGDLFGLAGEPCCCWVVVSLCPPGGSSGESSGSSGFSSEESSGASSAESSGDSSEDSPSSADSSEDLPSEGSSTGSSGDSSADSSAPSSGASSADSTDPTSGSSGGSSGGTSADSSGVASQPSSGHSSHDSTDSDPFPSGNSSAGSSGDSSGDSQPDSSDDFPEPGSESSATSGSSGSSEGSSSGTSGGSSGGTSGTTSSGTSSAPPPLPPVTGCTACGSVPQQLNAALVNAAAPGTPTVDLTLNYVGFESGSHTWRGSADWEGSPSGTLYMILLCDNHNHRFIAGLNCVDPYQCFYDPFMEMEYCYWNYNRYDQGRLFLDSCDPLLLRIQDYSTGVWGLGEECGGIAVGTSFITE